MYTLAFVRVAAAHEHHRGPHRDRDAPTRGSRPRAPRATTASVDRNLVLITAANVGGSILALFIGATGVMNTSLLSFFERIREFGLLPRRRLEPARACSGSCSARR